MAAGGAGGTTAGTEAGIVNAVDDIGSGIPSTLYHYTDDATAALIEGSQLGLPGTSTYLTNKGGLSAVQAQIELALPTRNTGTAVFAVDARVLDSVNLVRTGRVTGNVFNRAGGGTEFVFNQTIPPGYFTRIR